MVYLNFVNLVNLFLIFYPFFDIFCSSFIFVIDARCIFWIIYHSSNLINKGLCFFWIFFLSFFFHKKRQEKNCLTSSNKAKRQQKKHRGYNNNQGLRVFKDYSLYFYTVSFFCHHRINKCLPAFLSAFFFNKKSLIICFSFISKQKEKNVLSSVGRT